MPDDERQWASGDLTGAENGSDDGSDLPLPGRWPHARYNAGEQRRTPGAHLSLPEAKEATRDRARAFEALLTETARRHWPRPPRRAQAAAEPPRRTGMHARLLPVLQAIPWALLALFLFSFVWDFPGWAVGAFGYSLSLDGLLRIVSVSGGIGFLTNWLAVTMLFQPRQPRPVFGQGLIPAQKERVVWRLSEAISDDLINEEVIKAKIRDSGIVRQYRDKILDTTRAVIDDAAFRRDLKALTDEYARSVLRAPEVQRRIARFLIDRLETQAGDGLGGMALRAYRTLGERDFQRRIGAIVERLPQSVEPALDEVDGLLDRLPAHVEKRSGRLEDAATRLILRFVENLNVETMVRERMEAYDERKLERLFKKTSNEQLNYIKYLGGILGAIGGFVIWSPLPALAFFALVGLLLYALDETLLRMRTPASS